MPTPPPTARPTDPSPAARRRAERRLALAAAAMALADWPTVAFAASAVPVAARRDVVARTFAAFCDTLVPADELTPAASTLGVPTAILRDLRGHALGERLLDAGCAWLDDATGGFAAASGGFAAASGGFAAADEPARVAACQRMQAMPWDSPAGRFFHLMRNSVMAEYYVQPASWRGLALDRPLQPLGFFEAIR